MSSKETQEPVPPKKRVLDEYNKHENTVKREKDTDSHIYFYKKGLGEYMKERNSVIRVGPEYQAVIPPLTKKD